MGVEEGAVKGDGRAHDGPPLIGIAVVERQNRRIQLVEKTRNLLFLRITIRYGPAGDTFNASFDPPAIKNTQAGNAVERRLHAAGARSLKGTARRVQPE